MSLQGEFDAGTWVVHVNATRKEYFSSLRHDNSSLIHELYHGCQITGTTVGCWFSVLEVIKAVTILTFLEESRDHRRPLPSKMPFLRSPEVSRDPTQKSLCVIWKSVRCIETALLGDQTSALTTPHMLSLAWKNIFSFLESYSTSKRLEGTVKLLERMLSAESPKVVPLVASLETHKHFKQYAIGAHMIMENAAVVASLTWASTRSAWDVVNDIVELHSPFYSMLTLQLCAPYRDLPWDTFQSTAKAVFDLALMTPLFPGYDFLVADSLRWVDVHPGHRIDSLIKMIIKHRPTPVVNIRRDYLGFIERLCGYMGWPTPEDVARTIAAGDYEHLRLLGQVGHLNCFWAACELRRQTPWWGPFPLEYWWLTNPQRPPFGSDAGPVTALFFTDGEDMIFDATMLKERMEIQTWRWLGHQLMENERLDLQSCEYLGIRPDLRRLARERIVRFLETDPMNDGTGLGPLLSIKAYE